MYAPFDLGDVLRDEPKVIRAMLSDVMRSMEAGDLRPLPLHAFAVEADFELAAFASNTFEIEWPPKSGRRQSFPEIDRIAYFSVTRARRKILPGQRAFIDELIQYLKANDKPLSA